MVIVVFCCIEICLNNRVFATLGTAITTDWLYDQYVKNYANLFKSWHLMYNHRWYINKESYARYPEYNETVIWRDFNYTFAEMCRDVLSKMNLYL